MRVLGSNWYTLKLTRKFRWDFWAENLPNRLGLYYTVAICYNSAVMVKQGGIAIPPFAFLLVIVFILMGEQDERLYSISTKNVAQRVLWTVQPNSPAHLKFASF